MKKIIIISYEFPPTLGGAGAVAENVATGLSDKGYKIKVFTSKSKTRNKMYNFPIYEVFSIPVFFPLQFVRMLFNKSIREADIIVINDIGAALVASYFFTKKMKSKTIVYLHGSEPEWILQKSKLSFRLIAFKYFYVKLLMQCRNVVVVSNYMKNKLQKSLLRKDIKENIAKKILIVNNGVDDKLFYEESIDLRSIHGIDRNSTLLLSVSRIEAGKGYLKKLTIFKQLLASGNNLHWFIAGSGSYLEKFTEIVVDEGLSSNITFLGALDKAKLRKYYSSVDLFWLLSEMDESFGLVYVEAAFCGVPSIGRMRAGVEEAIIENKTGFLIKDDNECYNLINKMIYRKINKQQVKEYAKKYSIKSMLDEVERNIIAKI